MDLILVHSEEDEERFLKEGYGVNRKVVMFNDFVIVGPKKDPAKIKGDEVIHALEKISLKRANFISRSDSSGTNKREMLLWNLAGISPEGGWYLEIGQGMAGALRIASEKDGYTLTDRATFLTQRNLDLEILVEGEKLLSNPYSIIAVNPDVRPSVKYEEGLKFIQFLTSPQGRRLIEDFGKDEFSHSLFLPKKDNGLPNKKFGSGL